MVGAHEIHRGQQCGPVVGQRVTPQRAGQSTRQLRGMLAAMPPIWTPLSSLPMIAGESARAVSQTQPDGRPGEPARRWSAVRPPRSRFRSASRPRTPSPAPPSGVGRSSSRGCTSTKAPQLVRDREEPVELLVGEFAAADLGGDLHPWRKPGRPMHRRSSETARSGSCNAIAPSAANWSDARQPAGRKVVLRGGQFRRPGGIGLVAEGHRDRRDHLHRNAVAVHVGHAGIRRPATVVDLPVAPVTVVQPSGLLVGALDARPAVGCNAGPRSGRPGSTAWVCTSMRPRGAGEVMTTSGVMTGCRSSLG